MKTSWEAYSVDTRALSIPLHSDDAIRGSHPDSDVALLIRLGRRIASGSPRDEILSEAVEIIMGAVKCDSCTVYITEGEELVLRAWSNPHPETANRVKIKAALGITGWAASNRESVIATRGAHADPRVQVFFSDPLEDCFESFLAVAMASGGRLVGAINVQNREQYSHNEREISLIAALGFLVSTEIERARLESENSALTDRLETRKIVERAKGILQRELKLNEEDAYLTLQRESRQRRKAMKEVAEAIILSDDLKKKT
jgi:signal transduction protein with GAF and PtsI domain